MCKHHQISITTHFRPKYNFLAKSIFLNFLTIFRPPDPALPRPGGSQKAASAPAETSPGAKLAEQIIKMHEKHVKTLSNSHYYPFLT